MSTTTSIEVAHDTRLYRLLVAVAEADAVLDAAAHRVMRDAAEYRVSHTYEASRVVDGRMVRSKADDLPPGAIVEQGKTFTRGEAGFYVVTGSGNYRANRRPLTITAALVAASGSAAVDAYNAAVEARKAAVDAVFAHEEAYTGWARYFLVTSSAGHVHRSMHCSTCNPRTTYAPVVSLSGTDDATAVEMLGETLCTTCFPDAPVDGRPSKLSAARARKLAKEA